eukprot:scpid105629/ scgid30366/ 
MLSRYLVGIILFLCMPYVLPGRELKPYKCGGSCICLGHVLLSCRMQQVPGNLPDNPGIMPARGLSTSEGLGRTKRDAGDIVSAPPDDRQEDSEYPASARLLSGKTHYGTVEV